MSMAFELSKHDLSDLPRTDYGDEYNAYLSALEIGLQDAGSRQFYLISTLYTGYIEQLLSRIGVVSIRQILTEIFVDTLMKGVALVGGLIATLVVALVSFDERTRSLLVLSAIFFAFMAILLFVEFAIAVYRRQREELDFVDWEDTE